MHLSTPLFIALAFGGAQAFQLSFLVPKQVATGSSCRLDSTPMANENHLAVTNDRRAFVLSSFAAATSLAVNLNFPAPALAAETVDYKAVSADIAAMIKEDANRGPTLVRLAWHSSGTYDKMSKTGGSGGGTIRFKEELAHGGNAGLASTAVQWMEPIYKKYDGLSYADLYTLGGGMLLLS
jgi:catalase (peroxidase I)